RADGGSGAERPTGFAGLQENADEEAGDHIADGVSSGEDAEAEAAYFARNELRDDGLLERFFDGDISAGEDEDEYKPGDRPAEDGQECVGDDTQCVAADEERKFSAAVAEVANRVGCQRADGVVHGVEKHREGGIVDDGCTGDRG